MTGEGLMLATIVVLSAAFGAGLVLGLALAVLL